MISVYKPKDAQNLFSKWPHKWWVAGGWALDMYLGNQTREHEDLDVAILRNDVQSAREYLKGWDLWIGLGEGKLEDKALSEGEMIPEDRGVIWARETVDSPWAFEMLVSKTDNDEWVFKRDDSVRMKVEDIGSFDKDGISYLKPEIVLLHKAKGNKEKDLQDFESVYPKLNSDSRSWLKNAMQKVHPGHEWLEMINI